MSGRTCREAFRHAHTPEARLRERAAQQRIGGMRHRRRTNLLCQRQFFVHVQCPLLALLVSVEQPAVTSWQRHFFTTVSRNHVA